MKELLNKIEFEIIETERKEDGCNYKVKMKLPIEIGWIERLQFITEHGNNRKAFQLKHVKNDDEYIYFEDDIFLDTKAIYHYYFSFEANGIFTYYKKSNSDNTNSISKEEMWKMSVNYDVPEWAYGKIMYHIFVDRFNRSNKEPLQEMKNRTIHHSWEEDIVVGPNEQGIWNADFYGGDLEGIRKKLDYIKSLGVSIIYLSPIVWSQSNHRYDTADYEKVDPYVGTNEDLKKLCDDAHKKGIKVILDAVFNHTGNDSKYFNQYNTFNELGAYQSSESKYFPFYRKYYSNNQIYFDYWWGMTNLPVCDGSSKEWQNYIYGENGVIDLWFSLGIDGLRLDVADELSDEFIEGIRKAVKRNKEDGLIIGEVWKNPMRMGRSYISSGKGMDTVMDYILIDALMRYFKYEDVYKLKEVLKQLKTEYPTETLNSLMNFTSTHDITRLINVLGTKEFMYSGEWAWKLNNESDVYWQKNYKMNDYDYEKGKEVMKAYVFFLTFFPGILSIFYGDEVGLEGMGNLANRRPYPWKKEDLDLLTFFKKIGQIREKEHFLEKADFELLDINNRYIKFKRNSENEELIALINRSQDIIEINPDYKEEEIDRIYTLGESNEHKLDSHGALVLKKRKK